MSGDLGSVAGLLNLTELNLSLGTGSVAAPDGCPKGTGGDLIYPDATACGEFLAWLKQ